MGPDSSWLLTSLVGCWVASSTFSLSALIKRIWSACRLGWSVWLPVPNHGKTCDFILDKMCWNNMLLSEVSLVNTMVLVILADWVSDSFSTSLSTSQRHPWLTSIEYFVHNQPRVWQTWTLGKLPRAFLMNMYLLVGGGKRLRPVWYHWRRDEGYI